ncbi:hypothetical protein JR316_0001013 [Psilocybe cubensis]|uniref:Uncharacterized protein n=2 Tax=Psilocybe cubensis TaxID=181762 RepID=A0ACB8HGW6_PSICU|nr:hypothetical protein JR316_0001013 [Psilocybe cubensis]KAH9486947.1 hypothetical protein JR316_0001013 [Psilocybe cubensis]
MGANGPPGGPGPSSGYPPFYGGFQPAPAPQHNNPPAPSPYGFDADAYALKHSATTSAPNRQHRRNPTIPTAAAPLKSAMKKTMTAFGTTDGNGGRHFYNPFSHPQPQTQPPPSNQAPTTFTRTRTHSNPNRPQNLTSIEQAHHESPMFHMLVSFHNYNELHIEHITRVGLEEVRKLLWPIWQDGVESDVNIGHTCVVKFRNTPWDLNGPNVQQSYKLITSLFTLFEQRGYSFQTAVNIGTPTPRLIFQVTKPANAVFFIAFFSQDGRKITLIDPPNPVDLSIGAQLRSALPTSHVSDNVVEENTRVLEVRRKTAQAPEVDATTVFVELLKILCNLGFQLDATLPLGRRNALGLRYSRELLVFKSVHPNQQN